ncbi:unnamed protein product [Callosobruchus maculatus]|uniref:Aminopeptidase n=1 Tax=Callosobruchus maculatus TaxID=64391 RepID=A0A653CLI1_CALMS|nr:unnamed protein product [Callosobruchus maculatus]
MLAKKVLPIFLVIVSALAEKSYRLPTDVSPQHYTLDLVVDPDKDTFDGTAVITLAVQRDATKIQMHASPKFINIKSITLRKKASDKRYNCAYVIDDTTEILNIVYPVDTVVQDDVLEITYQGKLSTEDMDGFYRSSYTENGKVKNLAATQFEPVYARRAFPCFDEPTFKAPFKVSITHPKQYTALSNTQVSKTSTVTDDMVKTQFETTPKMSSYLVAFVVSEFVKAKDSDSSASQDYKWNVFARPSAKNSMNTALKYTPQLVDLMGKWTGQKYTALGNEQFYQVAIPDFAAGAMENWGLITYREVDLLDEGKQTSANSKQTIIQTIAHELSHQWFGDSVTLDWWSDLWLNEGFATYFQAHLANLVENGIMELDKQFVTWVVHKAFQYDALVTTTPISNKANEINTPTEINKKFDDISYSKAGSVIRMIEHFLGKDVFQTALKSYLAQNAKKNTSPDVLFKHFAAAQKKYKNFEEIMHNWFYEAGFPLVNVDWNETTCVISQERFNSNASTKWYIPITYATSEDLDFSTTTKALLEPGKTVEIALSNETAWIILNTQVNGFYRVNYAEGLWNYIIKHLKSKHEDIHVLNRAQLIDDVFNIAKIGKIGYSTAFELSSYLTNERGYYPWATAFKAFSFILGKVDKETDDMIKEVLRGYINSAFEKLPTEKSDKHMERLRNALIVQWACEVGHEECHKYVTEQFEAYKKTNSIDDYDKRVTVFCYALKKSSNPKEDYEFMYNQFKKSSFSTEQGAILQALGCIGDVDVLEGYLNETIDKNSAIRKQDAATVFNAVLSNSDNGLEVALKFFESNFDDIAAMYKGLNAITRLSIELASHIVEQEHGERLVKILDHHYDNEEAKLVTKQVHELLQTNQEWSKTFAHQIKELLTKSNSGVATFSVNLAVVLLSCATYLFMNH